MQKIIRVINLFQGEICFPLTDIP